MPDYPQYYLEARVLVLDWLCVKLSSRQLKWKIGATRERERGGESLLPNLLLSFPAFYLPKQLTSHPTRPGHCSNALRECHYLLTVDTIYRVFESFEHNAAQE